MLCMKLELKLNMARNKRTSATDCGCGACSSSWIFSGMVPDLRSKKLLRRN